MVRVLIRITIVQRLLIDVIRGWERESRTWGILELLLLLLRKLCNWLNYLLDTFGHLFLNCFIDQFFDIGFWNILCSFRLLHFSMFLIFLFIPSVSWTAFWPIIITIYLLEFSSSSRFLIWWPFTTLRWRLFNHFFLIFFLRLFLCPSTTPPKWIIFFLLLYLFHHSPVQLLWVRLHIFLTRKNWLGLLKVRLIPFIILKGQGPLFRKLVEIFYLNWYSWLLVELLFLVWRTTRLIDLIWSVLINWGT